MTHWFLRCRPASLATVIFLLQACSLLPGSAEKKAAAVAEAVPRIGLEINGVEGPAAENIRSHLSITSKPCTIAAAYVDTLADRAESETKEALQAFGYYAPNVAVDIVPSGDCPLARITVNQGEPVLVHDINIEIRGDGSSDAGFQEQLEAIALTVGQPLNHQHYTNAKQLIESVALERGYLEGVFLTRRIKVDPEQRRAAVALVFDSGPRYRLGELRLDQTPDVLDEDLIRRFFEDASGEPYTSSRITALHRALSSGAYFEQINVRPRLSEPKGNTIPVDISLTPNERHKISYGIGISTDEGIRGQAAYLNRRLNRRGHQLDLSANTSFIEQKFSSSYRIPRRHPIDEWLTLQAGVRRRNVDSFDTTEMQLVASESKRRPWGWMETRFVELNREDFDVANNDDTSIFLAPGVSWRKQSANDNLYPTRGYSINLELKAAAEAILSDTSFVRSMINIGAVYGLPFQSRAILRGSFGAMWVADFPVLPPSERFFAGGDKNIRGYDIDSIGPVDSSNEVIGGTYLTVFSAELEHYFTKSWGLAAFIDTGNAFGGDGSSTGFQTGIGFGLRWRTPVGPIRLDIAHPLDDSSNDFRLHLRIGPEF